MKNNELSKIRKECLGRAYEATCICSEATDKVSALVSIAKATKAGQYIREARALMEDEIREKFPYRYRGLSIIATHTCDRRDIKKLFSALDHHIKYILSGDHRSEDCDSDPVYACAEALRNAAREYATYGFVTAARDLLVYHGGYTASNAYQKQQVLLGIWEGSKDRAALELSRSFAATNPTKEYHLNATISVVETTKDWKDATNLRRIAEKETDVVTSTRLWLIAGLYNSLDAHAHICDRAEKTDNPEVLSQLIILYLNQEKGDLALQMIKKLEKERGTSKLAQERTRDLIDMHIRLRTFEKAEILVNEAIRKSHSHSDCDYTFTAGLAKIKLAAGYAQAGHISTALKWLAMDKSSNWPPIEVVEANLQLYHAAGRKIRSNRKSWNPH